jgi:EAL domain-containing protein (putative c-di-GMP-specific phosphodiesterase class I)/GGDEF domain-containing protein
MKTATKIYNKNTITSKLFRYFLAIFVVFVILFSIVVLTLFNDLSLKNTQQYKKSLNNAISYSNIKLNNLLIENKHNDILLYLNKIISENDLKSVEITYDRMIFNKNSLLNNTNNFKNKNWSIDGVSVDASYGIVTKITNSQYYEYLPIKRRSKVNLVNIKYQAYNKQEIKNLLATLNFSTYLNENKNLSSSIIPNFIYKYFKVDLTPINQKLSIDNYHFATIVYTPLSKNLENSNYSIFLKLFLWSLVLFFPISLGVIWYLLYKQKNNYEKPIEQINLYLESIEDNKYTKFDQKFANKNIDNLTEHIDHLISKVAKATNELNMNKRVLELKLSSDSITGLPNQNRFELDLKRMFISSLDGYVMLIRIDNLGQISKENSTLFANAYIKEVSYTLKNIIDSFKQYDLTLYRLHGSEFSLVAKQLEQNDIKFIATQLINKLIQELPSKYKIIDNIINIGVTPFDKYGTIESIMNLAQKAHKIAYESEGNSFHIIDFKPLELKYSRLEDEVIKIIEEKNFDVELKYDTYSFDDKSLLMKEVIPKLYDHNQELIPIGTFVSISQNINKIVEFDILNIQKAIDYIHKTNISHSLVINLSIETISSNEFLNWLKNKLQEDDLIHNKLIFSITSYTASIHKVRFKSFVQQISSLDIEILIKRYNPNEFTFDDLEDLEVDYIRINQDLTMGMLHDTIKKHKVKDIIIFAELNNIKILCDSIRNEEEYKFLDRLGVYGTSY